MAPGTDRSILLVLSAEQSRQLRCLTGSTATAPIVRSRSRRRVLGAILMLGLLMLGWLGSDLTSTFIQWATHAPVP